MDLINLYYEEDNVMLHLCWNREKNEYFFVKDRWTLLCSGSMAVVVCLVVLNVSVDTDKMVAIIYFQCYQ
jgi:hypothetical protein